MTAQYDAIIDFLCDLDKAVQRSQLLPARLLARLNQNTKELKDNRYRNNVRLLFNEFLNFPVVFKGGKVLKE